MTCTKFMIIFSSNLLVHSFILFNVVYSMMLFINVEFTRCSSMCHRVPAPSRHCSVPSLVDFCRWHRRRRRRRRRRQRGSCVATTSPNVHLTGRNWSPFLLCHCNYHYYFSSRLLLLCFINTVCRFLLFVFG